MAATRPDSIDAASPAVGRAVGNVDLHSHSWVSDGTLDPVMLVERAHRQGVTMLALTDHDEVSGVAPAQARADELGLHCVAGVEISVTWSGHTVHIVGLRVDVHHAGLLAGLARNRQGRFARAQAMARQLQSVGLPDSLAGALARAENPAMVSRSHFARYLVAEGFCVDIKEAFARYLGPGRPGYVPQEWVDLSTALSWIQAAGGVAVLAHPGRYPLTPLAREALLTQFRDGGGRGLEVVCGSHTADQYREFAELAQRFDLCASRGSDFHAPEEGRHDLGALPPLPPQVRPIWHDWPECVQDSSNHDAAL